MKYAIATTEADALTIQAADDESAGLPWRAVYLDGSPAPDGEGVTTHLYDVRAHPDGTRWAYPVAEAVDPSSLNPGDPGTLQPGGKGGKVVLPAEIAASTQVVDDLDETWTAAPLIAPPEGT